MTDGIGAGPSHQGQSFLQNPYYFMFASLAKPDEDVELHWLKVNICRKRSAPRYSSLANREFSFLTRPCLLSGRKNTVHHRLGGLLALPPQRLGEFKRRRRVLRVSGLERADRGKLSAKAEFV